MRHGRRTARDNDRIWFLTVIDGPHAGCTTMAPMSPLFALAAGQIVEVQHGLDVYAVEVVDAGKRASRHLGWVRGVG